MTRRVPIALVAAALSCSRGPQAPPAGHVEIEEVTPGYAAAAAGLRAGDVVSSWDRGPASGAVRTPFDLYLLEIREAPRGRVTLRGRRGATALAVTMPPGAWEMHARPLPGGAATAAWPSYRAARAAAASRDWQAANRAHADAVEHALREDDPAVTAWLEREAGFTLGRQARLPESRAWHQRALERRREAAPGGLEVAGSLLDLAIVALLLNELEPADRLSREALAIVEREAPGSLLLGTVLGYAGLVQEKLGDLAKHEEMGLRALAVQEAADPSGAHTAETLHNLGNLVRRRGDYRRAEEYLRRALALRQLRPPGRPLGYTLLALGHVARARGDLDSARDAYERALDLVRRHGPDATAEGVLEVSLGNVAFDRGDLDRAERRYTAALGVFRAATPSGSGVIHTLDLLGEVARLRGDPARAAALHREALALLAPSASEGLDAARSWFHLGECALAEGQWAEAERRLRRALAIQERAAPETTAHAEILHRLGLALWRGGRPAAASPLLARATEVLDAQQGRLGGPDEAASRFRARYLRLYRDAMELLLSLGRDEAAFETLERSRAVALRQMLSRRDLSLERELPPDLDARRRAAAAEYDRVQRQLADLPADVPPARVEALLRELREVRQRRQRASEEVRRLSPRWAALNDARALSVAEAAASLDAGTVALSYAVSEEATRVFALDGAGRLRVARVEAGEAELRRQVERFRLLLAAHGPGPEARERVRARGEELYRLLLEPVASSLEPARALLVVPDGPLHLLPFAALVRPSPAGAHFVAEWKPAHYAASLTVRAGLGRDRSRPRHLVAFGDVPAWNGPAAFPALPASRAEVEAVTSSFGGRAFLGRAATEERVKEVAASAHILHLAVHGVLDDRLPMDSGLVLAPGGEAPGANGLLQAWEIVEELRLDADLVTLSACETALGSEVPGEGVLGLTSALHFAGAEAVLASLWQVSDASTAALMKRFYAHLAAGRTQPEALQAAQVELIRRATPPSGRAGRSFRLRGLWSGVSEPPLDATHPHHWAAFQLMGAAR